MAEHMGNAGGTRRNRWSVAIWGGAALLLLIPLVAMQFTDEVKWDETDFIVMGAMLLVACGTCELANRLCGNAVCRAATGVAVATAFVLVWINLAVGVFGNEDNPANLMFGGVLGVLIVGTMVARLRPRGMARAMMATAATQALVAAVGLVFGFGESSLLAAFFVIPWLVSRWLFRKAARDDLANILNSSVVADIGGRRDGRAAQECIRRGDMSPIKLRGASHRATTIRP